MAYYKLEKVMNKTDIDIPKCDTITPHQNKMRKIIVSQWVKNQNTTKYKVNGIILCFNLLLFLTTQMRITLQDGRLKAFHINSLF
jgi:hypothetical protein